MAAKHPHQTLTTLPRVLAALAIGGALAGGVLAAAARAVGSSRPSAVQIVRVSTHSFDWGDAGIGAAAGIGISMLVLGAALLITSSRREPKPTPRLTTRAQP